MRIAIADQHMIIRRGMQLIVSQRPGWQIAVEAANADELLDGLRKVRVDVIVLDVMLGERSGIDLLAQLRRELPSLPALFLSSFPEEQYALMCLRAGARGYVEKDSTADEILDAIERVAAGRTWVSAAVTEQMAAELLKPAGKAPHQLLSPREFEVFRLIAAGRSMTEIAASMQVSVKTASTYRTRILEKMGMSSNAQLISYAVRNGLVQ